MNIRNSPVAKIAALIFLAALGFSTAATISTALAQDEFRSQFSDLLGNGFNDGGAEYTLTGDFTVDKGTRNGTLNIVMQVKPGWHAYSQKELSGQTPTSFEVKPSDDFKIAGPFTPDKQPHAKTNVLGEVEEFEGTVTWSAPIEFAEGANVEGSTINVRVRGQVCSTACVPITSKGGSIAAQFKEYKHSVTAFHSDNGSIKGEFDKSVLQPGDSATLKITAKMKPGWHIYKNEPFKRENSTPQPTLIFFTKPAGMTIGNPTPSAEPVEHEINLPNEKYIYYHEDSVTWNIPVIAPQEVKIGQYVLEGKIAFQFCTDSTCEQPRVLDFKLPVKVADVSRSETTGIALSISEQAPDELSQQSKAFWAGQIQSDDSQGKKFSASDLGFFLVMAFFAGLILNAMPCVLPVIGLKVMSFIQQAGENRGRIFLLNLVFSLGLMTVFWILATLSTFFEFGWGDWLTKSFAGAIIMTSVVFAFGLSMLGVWEIPIPGISGSSGIGKKAEEEGLLGAYLLGILTTILATPCTGPMLVPAITFTVGQPPWVAYLIFTTLGLGMALPYLMVGVFPSLIGWLPRPGAWMNTFKQITGFILMGTVVFLMASFSSEPRSEYLVAMMTTLLCIAVACWWIGRTSLAAETGEQLKAWGTAIALIAVGAYASFTVLGPSDFELEWRDYSRTQLAKLTEQNRLVFIDFTGPL